MTLIEIERKIQRLGTVWHVGLAVLYLAAFGFHCWAALEHGREGFRTGDRRRPVDTTK